MNANPPSNTLCTFTDLKNGVWVFKFLVPSHKAVDEWIAWQDYLINNHPLPVDNIGRMLLDIRSSGMPPFLYTLQQSRAWRNQYPQLETTQIRAALLTKPMGTLQQRYAHLIKDGVNMVGLNMVTVELFSTIYDQAVAWLLET